MKPVIATEIEFYLHGASEALLPAQILDIIRHECSYVGITLASVEEERGENQYEVALTPSDDFARIAFDTERFKQLMLTVFAKQGIRADFAAKPLLSAPGSGLHVHVHLEDESGRNIFFRNEDDTWSPQLLHAIGGLLLFMNPSMPVFAPTQASYARFAPGSNAPTTISWGTNNRTTAIRLPTKPLHHKHIEHRVAGSDADISSVLTLILAGIHYGMDNECSPGEPVYGDASLPQYGLKPLAKNLEEAENFRKMFPTLSAYFTA